MDSTRRGAAWKTQRRGRWLNGSPRRSSYAGRSTLTSFVRLLHADRESSDPDPGSQGHASVRSLPRRRACRSAVCTVGARRPSQNCRNVLHQLDATVEGPAADHVESNIGIAVVDAVPTAGAGDDGKDDHTEAVHEPGLQE